MAGSGTPLLGIERVTKQFPGVLANDNVEFSVYPGEIHALLGENGAGKSTLVKMIYGIMQPDAGTIRWHDSAIGIPNPKAARRLGIGMVFQHFSLFEAMTVLENIALGMDMAIAPRELEARVREVMHTYELKLDPHRIVSTLSVGERQRIEIVRALLVEPKLLIMDEPTSVLTPQEVDQLFDTLRQLAREGCAILYISHKLDEIKALCHTATILRGGKVVGQCDPAKETSRSMAELMIGGSLKDLNKDEARQFGLPRLMVDGLSLPRGGHFGTALDEVSFVVRHGEILGIAGVAGNGQNELLNALGGEVQCANGACIRLGDLSIGSMGASRRRKAGLCSVPEERNGHAAVPDFSLSDNAVLTARDRKKLARVGLVDSAAARKYALKVIEAFGVKASGPLAVAGSLSGGNLQKYIMGREILQAPDVLIVSQPTWGVDAGAAAVIHQALADLAAAGSAVVLISQDLDELLALSDTLSVMNQGRLSKPMEVGSISVEEIGLLMGGVHGEPETEGKVEGAKHAVPA